jgi:hypothetical protein
MYNRLVSVSGWALLNPLPDSSSTMTTKKKKKKKSLPMLRRSFAFPLQSILFAWKRYNGKKRTIDQFRFPPGLFLIHLQNRRRRQRRRNRCQCLEDALFFLCNQSYLPGSIRMEKKRTIDWFWFPPRLLIHLQNRHQHRRRRRNCCRCLDEALFFRCNGSYLLGSVTTEKTHNRLVSVSGRALLNPSPESFVNEETEIFANVQKKFWSFLCNQSHLLGSVRMKKRKINRFRFPVGLLIHRQIRRR